MKNIFTDNNKGAALVEFSIVAVLFMTLVLGVIEFSMMMKDYLVVNQAAREGARSAALGSNTSSICIHVKNAASSLDSSKITFTLQKLPPGTTTWLTLGNTTDGLHNDSQFQDQVKVKLVYAHTLVTGSFFSWMASGGSSINIHGDMVMMRE